MKSTEMRKFVGKRVELTYENGAKRLCYLEGVHGSSFEYRTTKVAHECEHNTSCSELAEKVLYCKELFMK